MIASGRAGGRGRDMKEAEKAAGAPTAAAQPGPRVKTANVAGGGDKEGGHKKHGHKQRLPGSLR